MNMFSKIKEIIYKVKNYDRLEYDYCNVLDRVTGSRLSKPNYTLDAVHEAINEYLKNHDGYVIEEYEKKSIKILVRGDIIARYIGSTELQVEYLMQSGDYAESYDERNFDVVIDGDLHIDYLHLLTDKVRICATGRISATR